MGSSKCPQTLPRRQMIARLSHYLAGGWPQDALIQHAEAETPVEEPSELREVSRWFGTGRSRGSAARQVEWLPQVESEEVRFASDSPLEGRVRSEPVSEIGLFR